MTREIPKEREARLLRWHDYMRRRRASRKANECQQQLQAEPKAELHDHTTTEHSRDVFPSFDDPTDIAKLVEFHQYLLPLESAKCSVCYEKFPSVHVDTYYEYLYTTS